VIGFLMGWFVATNWEKIEL